MPPFDRKLVSVIIPFLNGGNWLAEAVESVLRQSYPSWEAILIDDGSEEQATNIAREYSCRYPGQIIYTDHPGHINKGVTVSRNLGISLSKGSFIAFLDADDCWLEEKLFYQLELFKQHPETVMICEASRFWYSWHHPEENDVIVYIGADPGLYHATHLTKKLYPLGEGQPPCPTGIIIKRDAFNWSGGFEESFTGEYQLYEDQAFLAKIYLHENVYISDIPNNFYRKRSGSLTGTADDEKHYKKVRLFFLDWFEKYLEKHKIEDDTIMQLLTSARNQINQV